MPGDDACRLQPAAKLAVRPVPLAVRPVPLAVRLMPPDVRLVPLDVRLVPLDVRLVPLDVRLVGLDVRLVALDVCLVALDVRLIALDVHLVALDVRFLGQKGQKTGVFEGCRNGLVRSFQRNRLKTSHLARKPQNPAFFAQKVGSECGRPRPQRYLTADPRLNQCCLASYPRCSARDGRTPLLSNTQFHQKLGGGQKETRQGLIPGVASKRWPNRPLLL